MRRPRTVLGKERGCPRRRNGSARHGVRTAESIPGGMRSRMRRGPIILTKGQWAVQLRWDCIREERHRKGSTTWQGMYGSGWQTGTGTTENRLVVIRKGPKAETCGCCAGGLGSTVPGTCAPPTAAVSNLSAGTASSGFVASGKCSLDSFLFSLFSFFCFLPKIFLSGCADLIATLLRAGYPWSD